MLTTRLWVGSLLIVLVAGILAVDGYLAPFYPFLWLFQTALTVAGCVEMILLLGPERRPQIVTSVVGVFTLCSINWFVHWPPLGNASSTPWPSILGCFTVLVLVVFLWEMALFQEPNRCLERMGLTLLILVYLGLLPCFFTQLRWLSGERAPGALALAIFVPKACDIGAYFTGRLLGRHPMTPVLSPKKTWEGAIGGLTTAVLVAVGIDRWGPAAIMQGNLALEIALGVTVGGAGMLGDLAESLIKRDSGKKDASQLVPGFGGVLDVVDAIIFAAPVMYLWMMIV